MKILTVSIAAYNVEKYIKRTLDSMLNPAVLDKLEILVIDDGSKDGTGEIVEQYQERYPQTVKYIRKQNGGHGSTINKGMELATGKYFKVVDGDDWVDTDGLIKLVNDLENIDEDMVLNGYIKAFPNKRQYVKPCIGMKSGRNYDLDARLDIDEVALHSVTIKTNLLKNREVHITEKCFYVDIEFIVWATYLSSTVRFYDFPVYVYRLGNVNQSVSKMNMLKNVNMQEKVSFSLARMMQMFLEDKNLSEPKCRLIFNRIKMSIGATMRTYLLLPSMIEARKKIRDFDLKIRSISSSLFDMLGKDIFFCSIRSFDYITIPFLAITYRLYCRIKGYDL